MPSTSDLGGARGHPDARGNLLRNAAWAFGSAACTLLATLLVYRLVILRLSPGALGVWSIVSAAVAFGRLSDFALSAAHLRAVAIAAGAGDLGSLQTRVASSARRAVLVTLVLVCVMAPLALYASFGLLLRSVTSADLMVLVTLCAMASLIGSAATVVVATFDGLQVARKRAQIAIVSLVGYCVTVYPLVDRFGILSLALGQLVQYLTTIVISLAFIRRRYPEVSGSLVRSASTRPDLRFAGSLQATTILQQAFDYLAKYLFLKFGGTEAVGLLEIAVRATQGVRQLLTGTLSVLLPYSAFQAARSGTGHQRVSLDATAITVVAALTVCLAVFGLGPAVIAILDIHAVGDLYWMLSWTCVAWIASLWSAPLFYTIVGLGDSKVPAAAALLMVLVMMGAGYPVGAEFGWRYLVVAYAAAIWAGSLITLFGLHESRFRALYLRGVVKLLVCLYLPFLAASAVLVTHPAESTGGQIARTGASIGILVALALLSHGHNLWPGPEAAKG